MNSINPPQDQFNNLFDGLDSQMRTLEKRQEARKKILDALQNGKLQDALLLAKDAELILLDDPAFSLEVVKYWGNAKKQFEDTQNMIESSKKKAESGLVTLFSISQHFQVLNSLVSADHALRELELQNLQQHLNDLSKYFDDPGETQSFEKDWFQRIENDYKWLVEEEKTADKWSVLVEVKKSLQSNQFTDRLQDLMIDHPDSYLVSLWKQQDSLIRFRQSGTDDYLFEKKELKKILKKVGMLSFELAGKNRKKPQQIYIDQWWRSLSRLEDHLLELPITFFENDVKLTRDIHDAFNNIMTKFLPSKSWYWGRKKEWKKYFEQRIDFLKQFSSQNNSAVNLEDSRQIS
jgi:hypothetical protein